MMRPEWIGDHAVHDAANQFPMMPDERFAELLDSIRFAGLREPIVLHGGRILDGRNRYRACVELGIEPRTREYGGDPWAYVWDLNGARRDLTDNQRYLIWRELHAESPELQERLRQIAAEGNRARSEKQKGRPKRGATSSGTTFPERSAKAKAEMSSTNRGAVDRMDHLARERPDLAERVRHGEIGAQAALRELRRAKLEQRTAALPGGKYRAIYVDPPWKYGDERTGLEGYSDTAAAAQYPTMSKVELEALPVGELAAADSVLFCWATFPLLPDALDVVKAWGFRYKTAFVWSKMRPNLGHYHQADAELLLVATRGSGTPDVDKREKQVQAIERTGRHSEKPEAFRSMIDRMYPTGPRIELFRRGDAPDGWDVWGNESR